MRILNRAAAAVCAAALPLLASAADVATIRGTDADGLVIFSLNAAQQSGDLWFHFEAPSTVDWVAPAIGSTMSNSLIFLIYRAGTGNDVTISPRTANGHNVPVLTKDKICTLVDGPGGNVVDDIRFNVNVHCSNVTTWTNRDGSTSSLNLKSADAPFLIGFGPKSQPAPAGANDISNLRQHPSIPRLIYADMTKATTREGPGAIPAQADIDQTQNAVVVDDDEDGEDTHYSSAFHALFMIGAFVIVFPLGAAWMRVWQKAGLHWFTQALGLVLVIIGAAVGIYAAIKYDRFGVHPIIGLIALALLLVQTGLGALHHRKYKKTQQKSVMGRVHRIVGPVVILLGVANAFYGFVYAGRAKHDWVLAILIIACAVIIAGFALAKRKRDRQASQLRTDPNAPVYPPPPQYTAQAPSTGFYAPPSGPPPGHSELDAQSHHAGGVTGEQESGRTALAPQRPPLYQQDSHWGNSSQHDIQMTSMQPVEPKSTI